MNFKIEKGFTLIELIVVTAIISLLASIAISFIGSANTKASDTGKIRALQEVRTALNTYFNDNNGGNGSYPDDILILVNKKYISSIDKNIKYAGFDCLEKFCKNYGLGISLSRKDNKITYGTKSDCNSIKINSDICYFVSSSNQHLADLPYINYNNSKLYISPFDNSASETWDNAVNLCANLNLLGYNDWFLPNIQQLQQLMIQKNNIKTENYSGVISSPETLINGYWSTTEISPLNARYISSGSYSYERGGTKYDLRQVRCVR